MQAACGPAEPSRSVPPLKSRSKSLKARWWHNPDYNMFMTRIGESASAGANETTEVQLPHSPLQFCLMLMAGNQ
eukprot:scaffold296181_cov12-Tisochrysis_lutea.AAC.1